MSNIFSSSAFIASAPLATPVTSAPAFVSIVSTTVMFTGLSSATRMRLQKASGSMWRSPSLPGSCFPAVGFRIRSRASTRDATLTGFTT